LNDKLECSFPVYLNSEASHSFAYSEGLRAGHKQVMDNFFTTNLGFTGSPDLDNPNDFEFKPVYSDHLHEITNFPQVDLDSIDVFNTQAIN